MTLSELQSEYDSLMRRIEIGGSGVALLRARLRFVTHKILAMEVGK